MEEFLEEHGEIIISGIISIVILILIFIVMIAVANMEAYTLEGILGG